MDPSIDFASSPAKISPGNLPLVLFAAAVTTALTLAAVYLLESHGVAVMGWYADYVLPVGAIFVGLFAGSGAGFAARYLEYRVAVARFDGDPPSFLVFFDYYARSMSFEENGKVGDPGGLAGPAFAKARLYCGECNRYMRSKKVSILAMAAKPALFGIGKKTPQEEQAIAIEAQLWIGRLHAAAVKGDAAALDFALGEHAYRAESKAAMAAGGRVEVVVARCDGCKRGDLIISELAGTARKTKRINQTVLPLAPDVAQALRA